MNHANARRWRPMLLAAALFLGSPAVMAQANTGAIEITTTSAESGRPIANATVTIAPREGSPTVVSTGADGRVSVEDLAVGLYAVTAEADGVVTGLEPSVRISARKTTPLAMNLISGSDGIEEIIVVARALQADRFGAVSSSILNREELRSAVGTGSDVMRALDGLPGLVSTGDFANFTVRGRGPRGRSCASWTRL